MSIASSSDTARRSSPLRDDRVLTAEQVLFIHAALIDATGGAHGVRDLDAFAAAIERPLAGPADRELYPTPFEKAASLLQSLIGNHPFVDGNKRTGMAAASLFLEAHGWLLVADQRDVEDYAVLVAVDSPTVEEIAAWLERHVVRMAE